ncbi:unnamed protein product [Owenia fusiformis]|uniref:Uncharacterized protein n=1 Tax=Owenia fusiformis TaxID=6347 RepID=A0A8J1UF31_OWEFU|nr:unnamed protein product [Owenia fusiformis]
MECDHLSLVLGLLLCCVYANGLGIYKLGKELIVNGNMEYDNWDSQYQWYSPKATVTQVPGVVGNAAAILEKNQKSVQFAQRLFDDRALESGGYYYMEGYVKLLNHPGDEEWYTMNMKFRYTGEDSVQTFLVIGSYPRLRDTDGWVKIAGEFRVPVNSTGHIVNVYSVDGPNLQFAVDEVSLKQIIPDDDWEAAANEMIDEYRKGEVNVNVNITYNLDPSYVTFKIKQLSHDFQLGAYVWSSTINGSTDTALIRERYQNYVYDNFNSAATSRGFRWKFVEKDEGVLNFETVDKAVYSLTERGVNIVGGEVFWDSTYYGWPAWVNDKTPTETVQLMEKRVNDVVGYFNDRVNTWIVSRDNLQNGVFLSKTGDYKIVDKMFDWMEAATNGANLILTNINVLRLSTFTSALVNQAKTLKDSGHTIQIGAMGIFDSIYTIDPIELMARLDILAQAEVPIVITNLIVQRTDVMERAQDLEKVLRVIFAHPNVERIIMDGFWDGRLLREHSSLVDTDKFVINKAGWTLSRLFKKEWRSDGILTLPEKYLAQQTASFRAFYGDYEMDVMVDDAIVETRKFSVHKGIPTNIDVDINKSE